RSDTLSVKTARRSEPDLASGAPGQREAGRVRAALALVRQADLVPRVERERLHDQRIAVDGLVAVDLDDDVAGPDPGLRRGPAGSHGLSEQPAGTARLLRELLRDLLHLHSEARTGDLAAGDQLVGDACRQVDRDREPEPDAPATRVRDAR